MKKTTAIFFLLFLSFSQLGHLLVYYVQLTWIKHQVREQILSGVEQQRCTVIENTGQIRWEEEGQEFSLQGEMYDVVAIKKTLGKTLLYCLNDRNEDALVRNFARILSSGHEKGKTGQQDLKFHITDQYILHSTLLLARFPDSLAYAPVQVNSAPHPSAEIHVPPPRPRLLT